MAVLRDKVKAESDRGVPRPERTWSTYLARKADFLAFRKLQDSTGICLRLLTQIQEEADDRRRVQMVTAASAAAAPLDVKAHQDCMLSRLGEASAQAGCSRGEQVELRDGNAQQALSVRSDLRPRRLCLRPPLARVPPVSRIAFASGIGARVSSSRGRAPEAVAEHARVHRSAASATPACCSPSRAKRCAGVEG
jgi:hypothetical protein